MKVVAFNSSPMMAKGNTSLVLTPFLEGIEAEGAEVRVFFTRQLDINPCHGDFHCWTRHPGSCYQHDDMAEVLSVAKDADVWVLASPLFVDGLSGPLKTLLDRLIPLLSPYVEFEDDRCRHPLREDTRGGKVVLVSNCGFWEKENFHPLLVHMEAICKNVRREFAGALLRPHGPALKPMLERGLPVGDVLEAARDAGRQLAATGRMDPETLDAVSRDLMPRDLYVNGMNARFETAVEKWARRRGARQPSGGLP